ncbi:MAG: polyprenyl synthetase family protein [Burkholderiaceae bacterium]
MSRVQTATAAEFALDAWSRAELARVERALSQWVGVEAPDGLDEAMRYAVLGGGKRLRALLVRAAFEAVRSGAAPQDAVTQCAREAMALRAACAVELIHAYSLVHDDMPCMDDDVLRRGKPTVHVQYGEALALLAGDALQAFAFELLTPDDVPAPAEVQATLCRLLARAAGSAGMAGGQAIDLASVGRTLDLAQLRRMHELKTGALLQASVLMGAACGAAAAMALRAPAWTALMRYGAALGLAFQVVDDILDVTADSATLGKTAGKDAAHGKPTYVSVLGLEGARAQAQQLLAEAHAALAASGLPDTRALAALADMVVCRSH